jgi:hypothetical protein
LIGIDNSGAANAINEMQRLISANPFNAECIFPYIGGEEVNDSPAQEHFRYIINFRDWPLQRAELGASWFSADKARREEWLRKGIVPGDYPDKVAADYPELLSIVAQKVKPYRDQLKRDVYRNRWWQFGEKQTALYNAIRNFDHVLVISRVGQRCAFALIPAGKVYADSLVVFCLSSLGSFCIMQSRIHEVWARFFASSMKDDLRYTPSDCFETFPFPDAFESNAALEQGGLEYYEFRAALMVRNKEGLTKTYNRFHDPDERQPDILRLRELHAAMDAAVLAAYDWDDIAAQARCEFLLDYEDEADDNEGPRRRRKPWRYRWPDEIRDEVLARLLALNAARAQEEQLTGEAAAAQTAKPGARKSRKKRPTTSAPDNQAGFEFKES